MYCQALAGLAHKECVAVIHNEGRERIITEASVPRTRLYLSSLSGNLRLWSSASPRQRAKACSPGRVREPWDLRVCCTRASPRERVPEVGQSRATGRCRPLCGLIIVLSFYPALADSRWAQCLRPLRGLKEEKTFDCHKLANYKHHRISRGKDFAAISLEVYFHASLLMPYNSTLLT